MLKLDVDKKITGRVLTISGNVGNGKNTLAVAICRVLMHRCIHNVKLDKVCLYCNKYQIPQELRKLRVFANFPLSIPDLECNFMNDYRDFLAIRPSLQHTLSIIDEPNAFGFDSRESMSSETPNLEFGRKVQQTRHYNMDIIFITQIWSMVDKRGKVLSANSVLAVEPTSREFEYGWFKYGDIIPLSVSKAYARRLIFPYYDTAKIIGESINSDSAQSNQVIES